MVRSQMVGLVGLPYADDGFEVLAWRPSAMLAVIWNVVGSLIAVAGFIGFAVLFGLISDISRLGSQQLHLGVLLVSAFAVLVLHELVHGAVAVLLGGKPRFGAKFLYRVFPVFFCTVPGHSFRRGEFITFALAPVVGITLAGLVLMAVTPWGQWLVVPLAVNLGGAVGDFWISAAMARQPTGTVAEDKEEGLLIRRPAITG